MNIFSALLHGLSHSGSTFKDRDVHVRISENGHAIINDKNLTAKVVETILRNRELLDKGEKVEDTEKKISIELVTSVNETPK